MCDKLITKVDTYSTQTHTHTHTSQKSIPSVGFEPVNQAVECPQTYDLDHMSIWISMLQLIRAKNFL
jgi:hypothetical protein